MVRLLRQRGEAREAMTDEPESALRLHRIMSQCKSIRKRLREQREQQLGDEPEGAHRRGQAQEERRICRLIAGGGTGPRRRNIRMIAACTPTVD
eukprot:5235777-Pyramimonas_sp.AAC.1